MKIGLLEKTVVISTESQNIVLSSDFFEETLALLKKHRDLTLNHDYLIGTGALIVLDGCIALNHQDQYLKLSADDSAKLMVIAQSTNPAICILQMNNDLDQVSLLLLNMQTLQSAFCK